MNAVVYSFRKKKKTLQIKATRPSKSTHALFIVWQLFYSCSWLGKHPRHANRERRSTTHHFYWMCRRHRTWPCLCLMNAPNKQKLLLRVVSSHNLAFGCVCVSTNACYSTTAAATRPYTALLHFALLFRLFPSIFFFYVEFILNIAIYGHEMFDRLLRTLTCTRRCGGW